MRADDKLTAFIAHARGKGMDSATIRILLLSAGWKEKEVAAGIAAESLDLPVPEPTSAGGARDAFLYLLTFTALYAVVIAGIAIYFEFLNDRLRDAAWRPYYYRAALDTVRLSLAALFVAFPLLAWLTRFLEREVRSEPEKQHRPVRKWLTYLTLFITATAILCDLIALFYNFLAGGLTSRFVLKALVLLVVAVVVFAYYLLSLRPRSEENQPATARRGLLALGVLLVAGAFVQGFVLAGSPQNARLTRSDESRVNDLQAIHHAIQNMVVKSGKDNVITIARPLPRTLAELAEFQATREYARKLSLADPETGVPYTYIVIGKSGYKLCARFALPRDQKYELFWNHPAGTHCFVFDAQHPP
ncbi:MAG TPA: DUF5671 domain-containing protein [Pirellulales bacterium]